MNLKNLNTKKHPKYSNMIRRIIISYTVFVIVALSLLIYIYINETENSKQQYWKQNKTIFQSSLLLFDNNLIIIDSYCRQLIQNTDFSRLVLMPGPEAKFFYTYAARSKNSLPAQLYSYSQLPIDTFYIYLKNYGYILSTNKFTTANAYYESSLRANPQNFSKWEDNLTSVSGNGTFHTGFYNTVNYTQPYAYSLDLSALTYKQVAASISFEFNTQKLKNIFSSLPLLDSGYIVAIDDDGQQQFFLTNNENLQPDVELLTSLHYKTDFATFSATEKMNVTRADSSFHNWHFYLVQPTAICQTNFETYRVVFIAFMILLSAICIWIILKLTSNHMNPVFQLDSRLNEVTRSQNQLQEVVDLQRPYVSKSYLRDILLGKISTSAELSYITDYLQLANKQLRFQVIFINFYHIDDVQYLDNGKNLQDIVQEYVIAQLQEYALPYTYSAAERSLALLLHYNENTPNILLTLQEKFLHIHNFFLEQYSLWIFCGVGLATSRLNNVWESYQQAQDMIHYGSKNYIFLLYEMKQKDSRSFYYPPELSTKMTHFITTNNHTQVVELFHFIHQENIEDRSLPVHLLNFLLSDIRNTLIKVRFSVTDNTEEHQQILKKLDQRFKEPLTFTLCENIALELCELYSTQKQSCDIIGNTINYIKENFKDPSLGLNKISDEFQISESYFSHMFKERTGVNFSVYLEDLRLTQAIYLLKETNSNLSSLYLDVGYNSASTFRRVFKKRYGISPSTFRDTLS
jgi:AraC-type DNA-binding domain-containing proteins